MTTIDGLVSTAVSRDGTEIGYVTSGEGPPLLLVHGGLGDHMRWVPLLPHLEPCVTVHAMDRRGRGVSGDHPDYAVAREVEDVAAVVDAIAGTSGTSVDVYGVSFGASIAPAAATLTERMGRLALYEPAVESIARLVPAGLVERVDALLDAGDREAVLEVAYREVLGLTDEEVATVRAQPSWPNRVAAAHTIPREIRVTPGELFDPEQAARVTVPTLLLRGTESPAPLKADADAVAAALPDVRIGMLEGQAHTADLLAPELVAEQLLPFLREQR